MTSFRLDKNSIQLAALGSGLWANLVSAQSPASGLPTAQDNLTRIRDNYHRTVERAIAPLQQQYVAELKRFLDQSARAGKLEDALVFKKEIDDIAASRSAVPEANQALDKRLAGVVWIWNGNSLSFDAKDENAPSGPLSWKVIGPLQVEYHFQNGNHGKIVFDADLTHGTVDEIVNNRDHVTIHLVRGRN